MSSSSRTVGIRTLAAFAARRGSLDFRFTPSPSGEEGIEGQRKVAARRGADYRTEMPLRLDVDGLHLRGRADGFDPARECLEEIKTIFGEPSSVSDQQRYLHWAQLKLYGWLYGVETARAQVRLALIYFDLGKEREHREEREFEVTELAREARAWVQVYRAWQAQIDARLAQLGAWSTRLSFPFATMRTSQRAMAEAVFKGAASERCVLIEAPTGTGKTLATLFPALKAIAQGHIDKIFYLTCKGTARQLPLAALQRLDDAPDRPLRVLEITAKEKTCLAPQNECHGDSCPFAAGFYDKLPEVRRALADTPTLDQQALADIGHRAQICPYYLGVEMARWADIVVADVNYFFDLNALLHALNREHQWRTLLLVDEAHNLIDRARAMYSASLNRADLLWLKRQAPQPLKRPLERLNAAWRQLLAEARADSPPEPLATLLPERFTLALLHFTQQYLALLREHPKHPAASGRARDFFFAGLRVQALAQMSSEDFSLLLEQSQARSERLEIRNLVPAECLRSRFLNVRAACLFSATLTPQPYYLALLGLPPSTVPVRLASPFAAGQLEVLTHLDISTRYRDRDASVATIAARVLAQVRRQPGNALLFTSSYAHLQRLEQALLALSADAPVELQVQAKSMSDQQREAFVDRFRQRGQVLGIAVLGGAFAEGIDLPGAALTGVFIATLGMPQVNRDNETLRQRLQQRFGDGFAYTYTYPGIQKVVQAAGRVIRTLDDRGYLWLLDDRFAEAQTRRLLPPWWRMQCLGRDAPKLPD